jgi:imidazoleglycerol-phosphate dehydratase
MTRRATIERATSETEIVLTLELDGEGATSVATGVPFFDHMLEAFGRHGLFDLEVDVGICLGAALARALGDRAGIRRFGSVFVPMDEALVLAAVDISGRGQLHYAVETPIEVIGTFDTTLAKEFMIALAANAGITIHVMAFAGENAHHIIEAVFKAVGRSLAEAVEIDPRVTGVPSTKGSL